MHSGVNNKLSKAICYVAMAKPYLSRPKMTTECNSHSLIVDTTAQDWCAVYVRPSHEAPVAKCFGILKIESYLPQYRVEQRPPALDPLHGFQQSVDPVGIPLLREDFV